MSCSRVHNEELYVLNCLFEVKNGIKREIQIEEKCD